MNDTKFTEAYTFELPKSDGISLHYFAGVWSSEMNAEDFTRRPFNDHLHDNGSSSMTHLTSLNTRNWNCLN